MSKDVRYISIKSLIDTSQITRFDQIFTYIPKTIVARDLKKNPNRFGSKIDNPDLLVYRDIIQLSELIEVHEHTIMALIKAQLNNKNMQRKRA